MKKPKIKKYLGVIVFSFLVSVFFLSIANSSLAFDFTKDSGLVETATNAGYPEPKEPQQIIGGLLAPVFLGVIAMCYMIYGGYLWLTARGNEEQIKKARQVIITATIGMIIVMSAYAIASYFGRQFAPLTSGGTGAAK
jgi:hypothetical protein